MLPTYPENRGRLERMLQATLFYSRFPDKVYRTGLRRALCMLEVQKK